MNDRPDIIKADQVKKYFRSVKAVDGISLEVKHGEYLALLGPNGAGKTTLVEMIEGIQKPDSGEITILGKKWKGHEEELHRQIGISLQETRFFEKLTVTETFRLFSSFYNLPFSRSEEAIEIVNLGDKRKSYTVNLSGGQRQRLALGIALLNSPRLLLLDEPTTGLDPVARREIWDILLHLKKEKNTSMILTTHYMEEAELLCDRIVIIDKGKVIAQGTLEELLAENKSVEMIDFSIEQEIDQLVFPSCEGIRKVTWNSREKTGRIIVSDVVKFLPVFSSFIKENQYSLRTFQCNRMTLDDLFVSLTGRKLQE